MPNISEITAYTAYDQFIDKGKVETYLKPISTDKLTAFLEKIEYQSFLQKMEEVQSDAEKITYLDNDHYVKKYEDAIALDVTQMAQEENFAVKEIAVEMTENYEIKCIRMTLTNPVKEGIVIGKVVLEDEQKKQTSEDSAYKKLKEKLVSYYQLSEEQLDILYE